MTRLGKRFTAKLRKSPKKGGWTYVISPESVKTEILRGIGKNAADTVKMLLEERIN